MSFVSRVQRRLRGELSPPVPFACRDSVATRVFSMDDEPYKPSPRLLKLTSEAILSAADLDFSDLMQRPKMPAFLPVWPGEHYRLLAALTTLLRPTTVIEIGTFTGWATLVLCKYLPEGGRVATFDIIPWKELAHTCLQTSDFADGRLVQHVDDLADPAVANKHRALLASAELIFIDGPHDGPTEYRMLEQLAKVPFITPPLLVFDDIKLPTMLKFWRDLPYAKLDVTSFGHWSGTGLADWQPSKKI